MKAMDLVSASKLQKAKSQMDDIRPLFDNLQLVMAGIKSSISVDDGIAYAQDRKVKKIAYIVITSDRGLCGGYNTNVSKEALITMNANKDIEEKVIAVGSKGWDYFRRRGKNVIHRYEGPSEATTYEIAEQIGKHAGELYISGEADEVYLVHTHFETILAHEPTIVKLLPIKADTDEGPSFAFPSMSYDPDVGTFISYAVPMYLSTTIYGAMIESLVCEQASRMTSMDAATRNATEIIDDLTLEYNRKRQNMITQEITEIVSGANALQ